MYVLTLLPSSSRQQSFLPRSAPLRSVVSEARVIKIIFIRIY